uniref:hypothetical protein n=1 Tax=Okeania sp. SIO2F4 TaxID=2607790 RepID=UPI0025E40CB7|nr:hypothetical protein [Okeania sp. SIO2F4]
MTHQKIQRKNLPSIGWVDKGNPTKIGAYLNLFPLPFTVFVGWRCRLTQPTIFSTNYPLLVIH